MIIYLAMQFISLQNATFQLFSTNKKHAWGFFKKIETNQLFVTTTIMLRIIIIVWSEKYHLPILWAIAESRFLNE